MKYLKILALAAVAVGALMAFVGAGAASASKLCSTTVDPCPPGQAWTASKTLKFTLVGSVSLTTTEGESIDTCTGSTVEGPTRNEGSSSETVKGNISTLDWSGCTFTTTSVATGGLEIHKIPGTSNGTLVSITNNVTEAISKVTINTVFFGSCVYGITAGTSIGDLTEGIGQTATTGGNPAILHVNATAHKLSGSNLACPSTSKWVATYQLTSQVGTTLSVTAG
jgi:hypothetical protein